ncbi:alpha/beta hydrolase [Pseudomonas otitidis]|uniref:Alpha/beta hydrolase n=1 Tax=Metapseudomonas otitidis TaxID=319939 RepID=A0ABU3XX34_9GAMM|nr:alpha/beta hydrolase [Pseudomonas otitidis]MDV3442478.1 alpha/beta hydrolase [Pseudomonas otitidis]MEE1896499.1 alpha/beta hydrolase [Pseudomonas otitidis]WMR31280.1 alpha/beta hydrolase [Pseudomonas otitidis]
MLPLEHRRLAVNGIQLALHLAGPEDGPPVWLLHGFPECWLAWRHQIEPLGRAGYRVLVPDMRGYGASSAPADPAAYDLLTLCADIRAAMDALGQARVCVVGHDWGAPVAWHLALLEPQRVQAVVGMAVPFGGRPRQPATDAMRRHFADRFNYILYFQQVGLAEQELDADIPRTLRMMLHHCSAAVPLGHFLQERPAGSRLFDGLEDPGQPPAWCEPEAFAGYCKAFERHGFRGALNWYRNFERNWALTEPLQGQRVLQPALFLIGDHDPVGLLEAHTLKQMPEVVPALEAHRIEACGHWLQSEQPEAVNERLLNFLARHYR